MSGFSIGLNALRTAMELMYIAGDNIANANTPGYHAKRAYVVPEIGSTNGIYVQGLGSSVMDVSRLRNELIERSLLAYTQVEATLGQESAALSHLESLFGEPDTNGLDAQLGGFFESVAALAADPNDPVLRQDVVQKADSVCNLFRMTDAELATMADSTRTEAESTVAEINNLTQQIAELNLQIQMAEAGGDSAPSLEDARDQLISQLADLINVTTHDAGFGVVNVSCAGTLLVDGVHNLELQTVVNDGVLSAVASGGVGQSISVREGKLAGILYVANELLPRFSTMLDDLANAFRRSVNLVQTTGLGASGRFHTLEGLNPFLSDTPVSELGYGVAAGTDEKLVINVEDESTGEITQYELPLDTTQAADVFLTDLRDAINAGVNHVSAEIVDGRLNLQAEDGYAFDFATPYDPNPAESGDITATDPTSPTVVDAYTGETDLEYSVSFLTGGEIGTDGITIQVSVNEPSGPVLRTFTRTIDDGYDPGDPIELENGLKLCLSAGNVSAGDSFSFTAHASTDTAGVLDALGLNVFLTGQGAGAIQVAERIHQNPLALASGISELPGDNQKLLELHDVSTEKLLLGGTATLNEHWRSMVGEVATEASTRSGQYENVQKLVTNLQDQRDSVSGVSTDEETIAIARSQSIYQGIVKYMGVLNDMMNMLFDLL